jgi:hypothetical protein
VVERDIRKEFEWNRPERFRDDMENGVGWEVGQNLGGSEPFPATAVRMDKLRGGGCGCGNVVEEAALDEMLGDDGFVTEGLGEVFLEKKRQLKLMGTEAVEFFEVVVAGIGAGEMESVIGFDGEVEFGREFEVDELSGDVVAEEKVELAKGGVPVFLDLEITGEEVEARRRGKKKSEGVFVKMAEFLGQVEVGKLLGQGDVVDIENVGFRKRSDERRAGEEGVQKRAVVSHREGVMVSPGDMPRKPINWIPRRIK